MLSPEELQSITDTMLPIIDGLNEWIVKDIISRLMARLKNEKFFLSATDVWQVEAYKAAGGHYSALTLELKRFTDKSDKEIEAVFKNAGIKAWNSDRTFYSAHGVKTPALRQSESMLRGLEDTYRRTKGEIHNFTRTTAVASQREFIRLLDEAHIKVESGAQSYTQAVSDTVKKLSAVQAAVVYPTGHTDTIETAVLRAVRTGTAQASGGISLQGMIESGWDLIRVSSHLGARYGDGGENPSNHFWWQGKLYSRTGSTPGYPLFAETTGYGTGDGLSGWNCRHSFGPGDPKHNPFKDYDAAVNKRIYDLSQRQRNIESRIRRERIKALGLKTAVDNAEGDVKTALKADYDAEIRKLRRLNSGYNKFCEDNSLKKMEDRLSVAKWNREASRAAAEVDSNG